MGVGVWKPLGRVCYASKKQWEPALSRPAPAGACGDSVVNVLSDPIGSLAASPGAIGRPGDGFSSGGLVSVAMAAASEPVTAYWADRGVWLVARCCAL